MVAVRNKMKTRKWIFWIQLLCLWLVITALVVGLYESTSMMRKTELAEHRLSSSRDTFPISRNVYDNFQSGKMKSLQQQQPQPQQTKVITSTPKDAEEQGEIQKRALVTTDSNIPTHSPSSPTPTMQPTFPPSSFPTTMKPVEQTPRPTKPKKTPKPTSTIPTGKPKAPTTPAPTPKPTSHPTKKPRATPTHAPTHAPTRKKEDDDIEYPELRFTVWDDLSSDQRDTARTIGYHTDLWNKPGSYSIEKWSYDTLTSEDPDAEEALRELKINEPSWNCYVNHYAGFDWDGLKEQGVQDDYEDLGWTESSWEKGKDPNRKSVSWDSLIGTEQHAATEICYFEKLWDKIPLDQWEEDHEDDSPNKSPRPSSKPTSSPRPSLLPTLIPTTSLQPSNFTNATLVNSVVESTIPPSTISSQTPVDADIPFPDFRYIAWSRLSESTQLAAVNLGYTTNLWNNPGTAVIEAYSYQSIEKSEDPMQVGYVQSIGFTAPVWNCYVNHYRGFSWMETESMGVQQNLTTLGWTEDIWNNQNKPSVYEKRWDELDSEEKDAATEICWFQQLWDGISLDDPAWSSTAAETLPPSSNTNELGILFAVIVVSFTMILIT